MPLPRHPHTVSSPPAHHQFCCSGCRQVFLLLRESGLLAGDYKNSDIYRRSVELGIIGRPDDAGRDEPSPAELAGTEELIVRIHGMWCSACAWLIDKAISAERGVVHCRVIYASDSARIYFRPERTSADRIAAAIAKLGYTASPRDADIEEAAHQRRSLLIRMGVALFLMMNAMFFSYVLYIGYFEEVAPEMKRIVPVILFCLALPSVFWCGLPILRKAYQSLIRLSPTMEVLFAMSILSAFIFSTYALFRGLDHFYFDTAVSLVALLLLGKYLELGAKNMASENIQRLYHLLPAKVRRLTDDGEELTGIERLRTGELFLVKSGEKIPADGIVTEGDALVDESLLTGEAAPVGKSAGSEVLASSMALNGYLAIRATKIGRETTISGIIAMVEQALAAKSPLERTIDGVTTLVVPGVIGLAAVTTAVLLLAGGSPEASLLRGMTILLIACPCALGMATPLAIAAGIGHAAKKGLLIRDGGVIQRAAGIRTVVFDKTGTVTAGTFVVGHRLLFGDEGEVFSLIGSIEQNSNHLIAEAFIRHCRERNLPVYRPDKVTIAAGRGIEGIVNGRRVVLGTEQYLRDCGFPVDPRVRKELNLATGPGQTIVYIGIDGWKTAGYCLLGDTIRPSAAPAVAGLKRFGIGCRLLSGDGEEATSAVGERIGAEGYRGGVLPAGKIDYIRSLQDEGRIVAMAGDGVNDAPALAQADVGIALSEGTEIAIASADVTLLRPDLTLIPELLSIARKTTAVLRQNLAWAFLYNLAGLCAAVLGYLNPLVAAAAMLASSISVVMNSLRLRETGGTTLRRLMEIIMPWRETAA
ncbi:MAG TPA: cation-translocating P-type ATPase [Bacteroidota bacterium]|nr:cation-translocating P-type ATPase [Bacteroidota bacterium]